MSGRTFGVQASWDEVFKAMGIEMSPKAQRKASGIADSMNQQMEEHINRYVVSATNDSGDILFDTAGTYTFAGDVDVTGNIRLGEDIRSRLIITPSLAAGGSLISPGIGFGLDGNDDTDANGSLYWADWSTDAGAADNKTLTLGAFKGISGSSNVVSSYVQVEVQEGTDYDVSANISANPANATNASGYIGLNAQGVGTGTGIIQLEAPDGVWIQDEFLGFGNYSSGITHLKYDGTNFYYSFTASGREVMRLGYYGYQTLHASGTTADPTISFIADDDTGMYRSAANTIAFSCGNSKKLEIAATSTFTGNLVITGTVDANEYYGDDGSATDPSFTFQTDKDTGMYLGATGRLTFATAGTGRLNVSNTGIYPTTDNLYDCGQASFRWDDIRATNGTIVTSDLREKTLVEGEELGLDFLLELEGISFTRTGGTRIHQGIGAQHVVAALETVGKDPSDHAIWTDDRDGGFLGVRHDELWGPLISALHNIDQRLQALEARNGGKLNS